MTQRDALAPTGGGLRIAESARSVRPGELLVVDATGREITRRRRVAMNVKLGLVAGAVLALPLAALGLTGLTGGLVAGGLIGTAMTVARRSMVPYMEAQSRLSAGDLAGAEAILARERTPIRGMRAQARAWVEGWIAYARGEDTTAIRHFERCLALIKPGDVRRVLLQIALVDVHARSGQLAHARALRGGIQLPAPAADLLVVCLAGADLVLAIVEGTEAALDEDELHRWVRLALEINNTSLTLAALARVFAARGDPELADHLAREARDRFCWCPLTAWPELARWVDERLAALPVSED